MACVQIYTSISIATQTIHHILINNMYIVDVMFYRVMNCQHCKRKGCGRLLCGTWKGSHWTLASWRARIDYFLSRWGILTTTNFHQKWPIRQASMVLNFAIIFQKFFSLRSHCQLHQNDLSVFFFVPQTITLLLQGRIKGRGGGGNWVSPRQV